MRHLIDPTDLTRQETDEIVALAQDIIAEESKRHVIDKKIKQERMQ